MRKNDITELVIIDQDDSGNGIGKADGFPLFVRHAVIGDRVRAVITKLKKNYGYARTLKVLEPSPFRRCAPCAECVRCGGCQLQEMDYGAQLQFKHRKVSDCLSRIGGFRDIVPDPVIPSEAEFRYRNKAQFPVAGSRDGRVVAGFYAGRTHDIIPAKDCLLVPESFGGIVSAVLKWMERFGIEPYDEKTGRGLVRHIFIRKSSLTGEHYVCLVINAAGISHRDELVRMLKERADICGIALNINTTRGNVILGDRLQVIWGSPFMQDAVGGVKYNISPLSFYQVNHAQTEKLYEKVMEFADLTGTENVFDVYCGSGTISLYAARKAAHVTGIEIVPDAVRDAGENAKRNGILNAEFIEGRAEEKLPELVRAAGRQSGNSPGGADVVILDPPRKGCDKVTLDAVRKAAPEKIIYVSCNPATLARDLRYLCAEPGKGEPGGRPRGSAYAIRRVSPVDMFPQTVHVETVCLMSRVEGK